MGIKINQYPLERLTFGDDDYYDIDYWDGAGYQTAKIKGSVIKAGIEAGVLTIYANDGTLSGNRTVNLDSYYLAMQGGEVTFGDFMTVISTDASRYSLSQFISSNSQPVLVVGNQHENVGIGTHNPNTSAKLEIISDDKGILIPRLTTTQRNNITLGVGEESLLIYNTTTNQFEYVDSSLNWVALGGGGASIYSLDGTIGSGRIATLTDTVRFKDGTFEIQGANTLGTDTALAIYDGDSIPNKKVEFFNNGNVDINANWRANEGTIKLNSNNQSFVGFGLTDTINGYYGGFFWRPTTQYLTIGSNTGGFAIEHSANVQSYIFTSSSFTSENELIVNDNFTLNGNQEINANWVISKGTLNLNSNDQSFNGIGLTDTVTGYMGFFGYRPTNDYLVIEATSAVSGISFNTSGSIERVKITDSQTTISNDLNMDNNRIKNAVINPSVQETASTTSFTIDADSETMGVLTGMTQNVNIEAPTGTPVQGQKLMLRFKDDGTTRNFTWNIIWRAIGVTLPTATTANKTLYVGAVYNITDSKWDVIAVKEEA
jgi:hypothetical protein